MMTINPNQLPMNPITRVNSVRGDSPLKWGYRFGIDYSAEYGSLDPHDNSVTLRKVLIETVKDVAKLIFKALSMVLSSFRSYLMSNRESQKAENYRYPVFNNEMNDKDRKDLQEHEYLKGQFYTTLRDFQEIYGLVYSVFNYVQGMRNVVRAQNQKMLYKYFMEWNVDHLTWVDNNNYIRTDWGPNSSIHECVVGQAIRLLTKNGKPGRAFDILNESPMSVANKREFLPEIVDAYLNTGDLDYAFIIAIKME
ncbi:MAG: hypothetical protein ACHQUC_05950 [Chlamydiales bacterium]